MLEQGQQRTLAGIKGDEVKAVEHSWLGQLSQFGVDETAAQHGDDRRVLRLDGLRDAKRCIDRAWERHRQQHHIGLVAFQGRQCQAVQRAVDQVVWRCQRGGQGLEGGLAHRQRFGVADELEAWVDCIAQHVGDVVEVERCEVAGAVLHTERTESPGHRVATIVVDIDLERVEARAFGQKASAGNAVCQRRVPSLQKGQRRRDRCQVPWQLLGKSLDQR